MKLSAQLVTRKQHGRILVKFRDLGLSLVDVNAEHHARPHFHSRNMLSIERHWESRQGSELVS